MESVVNTAEGGDTSKSAGDDTPTRVEALLGSIRIGDKVFAGLGNNTRWVFDIDMLSGLDVTVDLLDFHGGEVIEPNVMSTNISAMSSDAADAKLCWLQDGGSLTICSKVVRTGEEPNLDRDTFEVETARILVRVSVDVVCR